MRSPPPATAAPPPKVRRVRGTWSHTWLPDASGSDTDPEDGDSFASEANRQDAPPRGGSDTDPETPQRRRQRQPPYAPVDVDFGGGGVTLVDLPASEDEPQREFRHSRAEGMTRADCKCEFQKCKCAEGGAARAATAAAGARLSEGTATLREREEAATLRERYDSVLEATGIALRTKLRAGGSACFQPSGYSMYPMVQSGDVCTFHPIQAVTAEGQLSIQKERSEIGVGDVVFCQVQPSQLYYASIVHEVQQQCWDGDRPRGSAAVQRHNYLIGNTQRHIHGWCYRENIFGILIDVQALAPASSDTVWCSRPLPKTVFEEVTRLFAVSDGYLARARDHCLPLLMPPLMAQSRGLQG